MKVDFQTLAAVVAILANSAGLVALRSLLNRPEPKGLQGELGELTSTKLSDPSYVRRRRKALCKEIFCVWMFLLHLLNLIILVGLATVLLLGPENVFTEETAGSVAEPLLLWEKILYWFLFASLLISYVVTAFHPTWRLCVVWWKAGTWLKQNEPKKKTRK